MHVSAATAPDEAFRTPSWVQDAIFYQIFPDRFAMSRAVPKPGNLEPWDSPPTIHGFKGGDLLGVVEHLDYLQDLGITAIYFCPIFKSTANHRYHTYDYRNVDPVLGGNDAFVRLLDEAHRRSIRIVLDGVFNHSSRGFFQFNHILENGIKSPYLDWFTVYKWPLQPYGPGSEQGGYWAWWNDPALPKFNTSSQAVREFLWGIGEYWIERGVDGWRLDVPNEIDDDEFWREFRRRVKTANPDAYIVGEIWGDARRWLAGDQFDAVMNYLFTRACLGFFSSAQGIDTAVIEGTGLNPVPALNANEFKDVIENLLRLYPWPATLAQLNVLDSHDTARFLTIARGDESALRLALLFQMTFPGAPCIYYGDEIGMQGGVTVEDARRAFPWDPKVWNDELRQYVRRVIALRHATPTLRRGRLQILKAGCGVVVFCRRTGDDVAIVGLNSSTETSTVDVAIPGDMTEKTLHQVFGDASVTVSQAQISSWRIPARSGSVLASQSEAT